MTDVKSEELDRLEALAKDAAERVAKNAGIAPQLAFAPILFALQDAQARRDGVSEPVAWKYELASAIRFGLETPCRSRHAAHAAQHVWQQIYGISLFDSHTPGWQREWARSKMIAALTALVAAILRAKEVGG